MFQTATLGKGQGEKEIGRKLACERPNFGHNLASNDKKQAVYNANDQVNDQNSGTIKHANETTYGHNFMGDR